MENSHKQRKIGILTFFRAMNYGAILQAWSLKRYLEKRGHEVVFIDYAFGGTQKHKFIEIIKSRSFKSVLNKIRYNYALSHEFESFYSSAFPETTRCYSSIGDLQSNPPDCDVYVVGSDQMWNPKFCIPWLPVVFLSFGANSVKKISYAVSFGVSRWPDAKTQKEVCDYLNKFERLSVRERSGVKLLKDMGGFEAGWHLDPVFLSPLSDYAELVPPGYEIDKSKSYIFYYILPSEVDQPRQCLQCVQSALNTNTIHTSRLRKKPGVSWTAKFLGRLSVPAWLDEFGMASFVVTNSFHGTVFSILNKKPFLTLLLKGNTSGMNERVVSLLTRLKLEERMIDLFDPERIREVVNSPIDWVKVHLLLDEWRLETDQYFEAVGL